MSWRKFTTHKEETAAVKRALAKAGYANAKVGHGSGTGSGWLHVRVTMAKPVVCACTFNEWGTRETCNPCGDAWRTEYSKLIAFLMDLTGRSGDYDGRIGVDVNLI